MAKCVCLGTLFCNLIRWIQLCDKKNLTFVDCCDKFLIKLVLKNVIKLAKSSLKIIFQDSFNKILSQQLTHDRSLYVCTFNQCLLVEIFRIYRLPHVPDL